MRGFILIPIIILFLIGGGAGVYFIQQKTNILSPVLPNQPAPKPSQAYTYQPPSPSPTITNSPKSASSAYQILSERKRSYQPTPSPTKSPTPTPTTTSQSIIINYQSIALFYNLPDNAITAASSLKLILRHASVGGNITSGLDSLYSKNNKYKRTNWVFQNRGNPGWQPKVDDLVTQTAAQAATHDVLSMKLCYVDNNADPNSQWTYYRDHMEELTKAYPAKKFIWWTMPIMTSGDANRDTFNNLVRNYAQTHNIILFDIASIESHDPSGSPVTQNGHEAMFTSYSSDGGHLTAQGSERVAQAFWVLMAKVSGTF